MTGSTRKEVAPLFHLLTVDGQRAPDCPAGTVGRPAWSNLKGVLYATFGERSMPVGEWGMVFDKTRGTVTVTMNLDGANITKTLNV